MPIHAILERLASVDENYRHLIIVGLPQLGIDIDVNLAPLEVGVALNLGKRLLDEVTEMTTFARIDHHIVHSAIVNAAATATWISIRGGLAKWLLTAI
jgi:hypothetical protein